MRASDDANKCVAFIGYLRPNGDIALAGTVFFLIRKLDHPNSNLGYAVTAKHVIRGIESTGATSCIIRMNTKTGGVVGIEIPLSDWWFHPSETEVDVAVTLLGRDDAHDFIAVPIENLVPNAFQSPEDIGIGDEVYVAGLFSNRAGHRRNIPIVRVGNIAAMPDPAELISTQMGLIEAYLIEVRSLGGLSGSPVFANLGIIRKIDGQFVYSTLPHGTAFLIGLVHGHYDMSISAPDITEDMRRTDERINKGIAIVVPSHKILEVLNQAMVKEFEKRMEQALKAGFIRSG